MAFLKVFVSILGTLISNAFQLWKGEYIMFLFLAAFSVIFEIYLANKNLKRLETLSEKLDTIEKHSKLFPEIAIHMLDEIKNLKETTANREENMNRVLFHRLEKRLSTLNSLKETCIAIQRSMDRILEFSNNMRKFTENVSGKLETHNVANARNFTCLNNNVDILREEFQILMKDAREALNDKTSQDSYVACVEDKQNRKNTQEQNLPDSNSKWNGHGDNRNIKGIKDSLESLKIEFITARQRHEYELGKIRNSFKNMEHGVANAIITGGEAVNTLIQRCQAHSDKTWRQCTTYLSGLNRSSTYNILEQVEKVKCRVNLTHENILKEAVKIHNGVDVIIGFYNDDANDRAKYQATLDDMVKKEVDVTTEFDETFIDFEVITLVSNITSDAEDDWSSTSSHYK